MLISAYLSIFDDWDILRPAMQSIAPLVDEIVVVDGAYEWMLPYFEASGRNPERSDPRVAECLEPFRHKTRFVNGVWKNELVKRAAGFEACTHQYVLRAD